MLPLISNALPLGNASSSASAPASAALLLSGSTDAGATGRQQLATAVTATGAPAAYFPGTAPQRELQPAADRTLRVPVPPPTGDYIEVQQPPAPLPAAQRFSVPVTLGIPLTTQLNAQFMGQQTGVRSAESALPREDKELAGKGREPVFGTAHGATAYGIAATRAASIKAPPEAEPLPEPELAAAT